MAEVQIHNISHRHEQIADWLLANASEKNLQKLCNVMNISRSWLSVVMKSDVFREYWAKRRAAYETEMRDKLLLKQLDISLKAFEKLEDILAADDVDDRLVLDIANKTAAAVGFAPSRQRQTVTEEHTQEVTRPVNAGVLAEAREIFRKTTRTTYALPAPESE
jgi:hypothetical protein